MYQVAAVTYVTAPTFRGTTIYYAWNYRSKTKGTGTIVTTLGYLGSRPGYSLGSSQVVPGYIPSY